jgi:hypothetical protein
MRDIPKRDERGASRRKKRKTAGLWIDANLAAKLRGGRGLGLADQEFNGETQRLLHYADIALGTKEPDSFHHKTPSHDPQKD